MIYIIYKKGKAILVQALKGAGNLRLPDFQTIIT
jgi:hypothetical protein